MSIHKVRQSFIGAGAALSANNTSLPSIAVQLGIVGTDMTTLNPAGGDTVSTQPAIYIINKLANGDFKKSNLIKGSSVVDFDAQSYTPATRNTWVIGYNRKTATGLIEANNEEDYSASIIFKNDKMFYSERPERLSINLVSAAAATQLTIATQVAYAINNSAYGNSPAGMKVCVAVVVGDGTGVYGLTGATNYGVEITALDVNQFDNTTYTIDQVYFSVQVDSATGFGATTTCTEITGFDLGSGTYQQIYNKENFDFGQEGVLNRTKWPVPTLSYLTSSTGTMSGSIAGNTATGTIGEDTLTLTTTATIPVGSKITIAGTEYEVKYIISGTVLVLTAPLAATAAAAAFTVRVFYDVINISVVDTTFQDGAGVGQFSPKSLTIATPAIVAGATALTSPSAEGQDLMDILNAWMATTPLAPAAISI
jgi:hypothetical protein